MCRVLKVSKSGYSDWLNRPTCKTKLENQVLAEYIQTFFLLSRMRYGSPRIKADLDSIGEVVGQNRVARIMAENGFRARFKKKYIITTDSNHDYPISPNLLKRNFTATAPNQKWVSDITYLWAGDKWIYLCVIIDLYSRKVVGWSISRNIDTELLKDAFLMAVTLRVPPKGLIFHSDRGIQYASKGFRKLIKLYCMKQSMSRKGDCWDNACAESFFKTLKVEEIYRYVSLTEKEVREKVFEYIEGFYNIKRRHSANNNLSPVKFESLGVLNFESRKLG